MKSFVTIETVHTHTHTQYNLINKIESTNNALLVIYARDR